MAAATNVTLSVERRNTWATRVLTFLGVTPLLAGGVALALSGLEPGAVMGIVLLLMMLSLYALPVVPFLPMGLVALLRRRLPGQLACEVDERGLTVRRADGKTLHLSQEELALAWAVQPNTVELFTHRGDEARVEFGSSEEAAKLIRALRRAAIHEKAYTVPMEGPVLRFTRKLFGTVTPFWLAFLFQPLGWPALFGLGAAGGLAWLIAGGSPGVDFGADGVVLRGRLRTRYIRYREIVRADAPATLPGIATGLVLQLTSGERVRVARWLHRDRARLLEALVDEGVEMAKWGLAAGAEVASLARGNEDESVWRERVAASQRESGYRGAALGAERLNSLMRNPAADPEQRVAAALALRVEPQGPARIRAAAEASTEPEVKEALEALAVEELSTERVKQAIRKVSRPR